MIYSGDEDIRETAKMYHGDLVRFCDTGWKKNDVDQIIDSSNGMEDTAKNWIVWAEAESRRRTGYSIWVCIILRSLEGSSQSLRFLSSFSIALSQCTLERAQCYL